MTDTTDDAVKLTLPEAAALARKAGEDAARMRKEARDAEAAHMTTERQHTLVGCSDCGRGYPPKHMVSAGDNWLCTRCAGAEIAKAWSVIDRLTAVHLSSDIAHRRELSRARDYMRTVDALGKEQP